MAIDTFKGKEEYQRKVSANKLLLNNLCCRFIKNIKKYRKKIIIIKVGESQKTLREFKPEPQFDFIYIDGSHKATDVLEDTILSFRLLKNHGILIWDDFNWKEYKNPQLNPGYGIDAFLKVFLGKYKIIHSAYQIAIKRISFSK